MPPPSTRWLLQEPSSGRGPLLFCFPYAGAGASSLRRWPSRVGDVEFHPVQLPGRENRIKEEAYRDFDAFAADAVDELGRYLDRPYALIGHCLGALLAHAFTARVHAVGGPLPMRLFVSASLTPCRGFYGYYHPWMSDRRIAGELKRVASDLGDGEVPDELVSLSVGVVRKDVQMCVDHQPPAKYLDVPVSAIGWDGDVDVAPEDLTEWQQYGPVREYVLPGEPLTFLAAPSGLRRIVQDDLES